MRRSGAGTHAIRQIIASRQHREISEVQPNGTTRTWQQEEVLQRDKNKITYLYCDKGTNQYFVCK